MRARHGRGIIVAPVSRIRILPDALVSQIAAGEVVERPASVVKELVENALDAAAREVVVELEAGGKRRVRVSDDGCGMDRDDALLAFDRHATSKIAAAEDLVRIATLGFRGEALAAIAAVARVELLTAEVPGAGHRVRIEGGRIRSVEPASRPRGTGLEIASLFFNVPARRQFLRTAQTELRRCLEVVQSYGLARPEVGFRLAHEERELLAVAPRGPGAAGLRERVAQIFGGELAERLVELPAGASAGRARVSGLVGDARTAGRGRTFLFVNRRWLRDRGLLATFYRAVRDEWRSEDYPALFLFLDLALEDVDVNVHPQKAEVRFRDRALLDGLYEVLRLTLQRGRREEPAVLVAPSPGVTPPLAWQGLGARKREPEWAGAGSVAEPPAGAAGRGAKIAEAVYAPLAPAPARLSGAASARPGFRLLGQYKGTLILLEGPDGLYLIDQHVAHERVLFERLAGALREERTPRQALLEPALLELAPSEALRLEEAATELEACGFSLRPLSGATVALEALPAGVAVEQAERMLVSLARDGSDLGPQDLRRRLLDEAAASLACRAAVKMHRPMSPEEMEQVVADLFACEQPYACPHGRPIVLRMTDLDLERRFGRS